MSQIRITPQKLTKIDSQRLTVWGRPFSDFDWAYGKWYFDSQRLNVWGRPFSDFPHAQSNNTSMAISVVFLTYAGRRTKFVPIKSLDSSEFSSKFSDLGTFTNNVKVDPVISWNGHNSRHFIGFFLRILRILLHIKFPSNSQDLTTPQTAFI